MITEAIQTAVDYLADLGLDATKDRIKNKIDEKKLRESLATYILSQQKYNEISSLAEEIDFQGLITLRIILLKLLRLASSIQTAKSADRRGSK